VQVLHDLFYVLLQLLVVAAIILSFKFFKRHRSTSSSHKSTAPSSTIRYLHSTMHALENSNVRFSTSKTVIFGKIGIIASEEVSK